MKANRFLKNDDEAVSPVIAVILMVAITVVLAATVYVWVSGFGASGQQQKTLSVQQNGNLVTGAAPQCSVAGATWCVKFTIVSVSANFAFTNLGVSDATTTTGAVTCTSSGGANLAAADVVTCTGPDAKPASGDKWNFVDKGGNSIVASITIT